MPKKMPPVTTIPSEETDDSDVTAFKVLNEDNLGPVGMVIGESVFKPFGNENQKQKPNIVVYPTRRSNGNLEDTKQKVFTKSNGYIATQNKTNLKKNFSYSYGNLDQNNHHNSAKKRELNEKEILDANFTKTLDAKLKKLQKDEKTKKSKSAASNSSISQKPFITTVKKGAFLDPPPEIANILRLNFALEDKITKEDDKKLYAYASRPRVLNRISTAGSNSDVHKAKCEAAAIAAAVIASGVAKFQNARAKRDINSNISRNDKQEPMVPYANLMFDKRVVRGNTYAMHPMPTCDAESQASRLLQARRKAMLRRKSQNERAHLLKLRLQSPPPIKGRRHERVQTENYLEELWERPVEADNCTQTDLFYDRPISPYYIPVKNGVDVETQIWPGDLFDYDMEVIPILEVLVGKTVEQALIEVLEEEELAALREQQRRFLEIRASECAETQRLEEQERRLRAERDRRVREHEDACKIQQETEERIAAAVLMQGYVADLLPAVLEGLNESGFLYDNIKRNIDEGFMPWLMKEVTAEMESVVSSRDLLTEIIKEILENKAFVYREMNPTPREPSADLGEEDADGINLQDIELQQHQAILEEASQRMDVEKPNEKQ